jgi:predicted RNA methylase
VVTNYIALRDQRDAQDLQLGMLRQSILDLAAGHGALARGSNINLNSAVALIQQELDATRALGEHFQSLQSQGQ